MTTSTARAMQTAMRIPTTSVWGAGAARASPSGPAKAWATASSTVPEEFRLRLTRRRRRSGARGWTRRGARRRRGAGLTRRIRRCSQCERLACDRRREVVLGKTDREIFLQGLAEETRRPLLDDDMRVIPRFLLVRLNPHFAVHLKREKVRRASCGSFGYFFAHAVSASSAKDTAERSSDRSYTIAGPNEVVAKRVVDAEITHLHAAEVLVARRGHSSSFR